MNQDAVTKLASICAASPVRPDLRRFLQKVAAPVTIPEWEQGAPGRVAAGLGNAMSSAWNTAGSAIGGAANMAGNMAAWGAEHPVLAGSLGAGALAGGALGAGALGLMALRSPLLRALAGRARGYQGLGLFPFRTRALSRAFGDVERFAAGQNKSLRGLTGPELQRLMRDFAANAPEMRNVARPNIFGGVSRTARGKVIGRPYNTQHLEELQNILLDPTKDTTGRIGRFLAPNAYHRMMDTAQARSSFGGMIEQRGVLDTLRGGYNRMIEGLPEQARPWVPFAGGAAALHYGPRYIWGPPRREVNPLPVQVM